MRDPNWTTCGLTARLSGAMFKLLLISGCLWSSVLLAAGDTRPDTGSSTAKFIKKLHPSASVSLAHDSNLFRFPDPLEPGKAPPVGREDQYLNLAAGLDTEFTLSQQKLILSGVAIHHAYNTYDDLDYTGGNALIDWQWSAGNSLNGNLGYEYNRQLRSFVNRDVITAANARDLRTERSLFADVNFQLIGDWFLNLRGRQADIEFSESQALNLERVTAGVALNYVSNKKNTYGFDTLLTKGTYDNDWRKNFDEINLGPTFDIGLGSDTKLRGKVGYTKRENDDISRVDYDDYTGRITLISKSAKGNALKAAIWREVSNLGDEIATFALVQGISFEPKFRLTANTDLRLFLGYENRDFRGNDPAIAEPELVDRVDKLFTGIIALDWRLSRSWLLTFGFDTEKRTSNREFRDFEARVLGAKVTFTL